MEYTIRERLINCDTHFDNDQIEAVMKVVEDSGYSDMYEACKKLVEWDESHGNAKLISIACSLARAVTRKMEGK